jgi:uncharacterized protein (DUF1499 family)
MSPGILDGRLAPCPRSPNCVCSDGPNGSQRVEPFRLRVPADDAWSVVVACVRALPRTRIEQEGRDYLHATCRSFLLRFADDLELHLRPAEGILAVRSASRVGYSDLGVNRRRVERLRAALVERGVVAAD